MSLTVSQIDTAITAILELGQTITIDGVTYSKANLSELRALRTEIQGEEAVTSRGTIFDRAMCGVLAR